jgi:hypothetical protein
MFDFRAVILQSVRGVLQSFFARAQSVVEAFHFQRASHEFLSREVAFEDHVIVREASTVPT